MAQAFLYLFTCGPLVFTFAAWTKLYRARQRGWPPLIGLVALSIVSANTIFAASSFFYYRSRPSSLPPWQDPEILTLALLFFLAPIGMIIGFIAAAHGTQKWLIWLMEIASVPLFLVGLLACATV